jgi:tetratricopeptide (TPR) repeat protein
MTSVLNLRQQLSGNKKSKIMRLTQIILSFVFLLAVNITFAQKVNPDESKFNNGKELLKLGKYGLAMQAFRPLTSAFDDNKFQAIASYYYAVAAFKDNQTYVARDMFLQLSQKYPNWEKQDEVSLWLVNIYLSENNYESAQKYIQKIRDANIKSDAYAIKNDYLEQLSYTQLETMLQENPSDTDIAVNLADKIASLPISEQDRGLLENIVSVFELDQTKYRIEDDKQSVKKDIYHVAVLLPFMTNELKVNTRHLTNEWVIELYEGMMLGAADLKNKGINIKLHLYDTKKDSTATLKILGFDELKHMDLIIGPLFPGPVKVVSDFAFKYQINMVNPMSTNSAIIGENPYAFLFLPSDETAAKKAAAYMENLLTNKNVMIFHGMSSKDSLLAYTYKQEIENLGFNVTYIDGISIEQAKNILDILTNTRIMELDESEFDDPEEEQEIVGNLKISEKEFLVIKRDSIGHVFIASNESPLVANAITALETRNDSTMLLGYERWLDQREIPLDGLERLDTHLIAPTFIEKTKPKLEGINELYTEQFNAYPNKNVYIGYEVIMTMGKIMKKMGNLFQYDPAVNSYIPGELFQGTLYGNENSNQIVPIIEFEDSELVIANPRY